MNGWRKLKLPVETNELRGNKVHLPPRPRSLMIPLDRERDRWKISPGPIFSLDEGLETSLKANQYLRFLANQARKRNNRKIVIDLTDVTQIDLAAPLTFAAECSRLLKSHPTERDLLEILEPQSVVERELLHRMGFFKLLGQGVRKPHSQNVSTPLWAYLKITSDIRISSETIGKFVDGFLDITINSGFNIKGGVKRRLHAGIKEALGNAVEHGYRSATARRSGQNNWYLTACYDLALKRLTVAIFDQGLGIPGTFQPPSMLPVSSGLVLRRLPPISGFDHEVRFVTDFAHTESSIVRLATQSGMTSTGQSGRGQGFDNMKEVITNCPDGSMLVFSNYGYYRYGADGAETMRDISTTINGTLVQFIVSDSLTGDLG